MQRIEWRYMLSGVLLACGASAAAPAPEELKQEVSVLPAAPDAATHETSLGRLEDIQAKTLLYEAQLAQAKALAELQKNGYDPAGNAPFNPQPTVTEKDKVEPRAARDSKTPPQVVEISGSQVLSAILQLENGHQVRVQAGNRIPGTVWTVAKITLGEVTVSSPDDGLISLAFAG